ncbi:MAG: DUF6941 family protein [Candidatus Dormibacteria bacterium]
MKLHAHFLADSANFNDDGTFTVFKGGINRLTASAFPTLARFVVVTRLEFDQEEASELHEVGLTVSLGYTQLAPTKVNPIALQRAVVGPCFANVISQFSLVVPAPGELVLAATVDDIGLPSLHLDIAAIG